ncbi:hypothetical protein Nepgr_030350 [Nepenthes gracilis]|uniref:Protein kinase domain-containing protein n=1 Tax=Nepenthes gracilis TaxID=150966 RepID=A0AAD3TFL7_NEPGR|nr:hypothetical protein Nepgr_030350 [Nepenthes gracilis]
MAEECNGQATAHYPLDPNSYRILSEIGAGVSAIVYKAICVPMKSSIVAIKSIDLDHSRVDFDTTRQEAKTMSLLSHPNVLQAHCSFTVDHRLWVVMPFMSAGSLQSIVSSSFPSGLPEPCIAVVLKETLHGLSYLHDQGHLHRDIKAGNILIDSNGAVKLGDFGVSASIYESGASRSLSSSSSLLLTDITGTPYWMAPEVIHSHNGYSFKADIWSFGITALELAHGRPPLSHLPPSKSLLMKITKRFRFSDYENRSNGGSKDKKFSKAFKDMVAQCLHQDPSKRPTAQKLLKHSFFKNCRNAEFLMKNILNGLPTVEDRFKQSKLARLPSLSSKREDDLGDDDSEMKQRRISGWNFNEDGFELDPVFPSYHICRDNANHQGAKLLKFEGQLCIPDRRTDSDVSSINSPVQGNNNGVHESRQVASGVSSPGQVEEATQETLAARDVNGGGGGGPTVASSERVVVGDSGVKIKNLLAGLVELRNSLDEQRREVRELIVRLGGGGEVSREEQLLQTVERLKKELDEERMKKFELLKQLDLMKISASNFSE